MKKKKMAGLAAVLCAAGSACAQSSVTVYGVADLALSYYKGDGTGSKTQITNGGNQQSRLGFRGREDLGGGLYAGFDLEAGLTLDNGAGQATNTNNQASGAMPAGGLVFNRKSFVSLGGDWGEVRLGRDYVPSFWPLFAYDPFRSGVGFGGATTQGGSPVTQLRASNAISYQTRNCYTYECQGFWLQAMYALGENTSQSPNPDDGDVAGLRVGYGGTNWNVMAAQTRTRNLTVGEFRQTVVGGSWDFGVARLLLLGGEHRTDKPVSTLSGATRSPFWQIGAFINVGPGYIPVAVTQVRRNDAQDSRAEKYAIGYVYYLSKRTALYTTYALIKNHGASQLPVNVGVDAGPTPLPGRDASGADIGFRHSF